MADEQEKTRIEIQPTGDNQYEAQVTHEDGHKVSKVFPTHDEAMDWAQSVESAGTRPDVAEAPEDDSLRQDPNTENVNGTTEEETTDNTADESPAS